MLLVLLCMEDSLEILIDVFLPYIIDYHIGLSYTAVNAYRVLKNGLRKRDLYKG